MQVVTHRCHLPTPNIFHELGRLYFDAKHLSQDARLHDLLRLAIRNMINVHTLRIVYGHMQMTHILLEEFLNPDRPQRIPLRRLWLESCSLVGININFMSAIRLSGLESIRLRRMRIESAHAPELNNMRFMEFKLSRGGQSFALQNGSGGFLWSTVEISTADYPPRWPQVTPEQLKSKAEQFDAVIWEELPQIQQFVETNRLPLSIPQDSPVVPVVHLLTHSSSSLTNLCLDWLIWRQKGSDTNHPALAHTMQTLSTMRFPNLRSFQVRNAVVPQTLLPDDIYLLESPFLEFLEYHTKIQCLGWPLDLVYSHRKAAQEVQSRSRRIVAHLGTILTDLRLDTYHHGNGEMVTDEGMDTEQQLRRVRRRRFVCEFAPHMRRIEQVKLEGGIPRDEKREILRALRCCRIKKLVMIGVSFPLGNTWGARGVDLIELDPGHPINYQYKLEEEDIREASQSLEHERQFFPHDDYVPCFGWPTSPPFLHTIALDHASTIEELKLCGYNGSPILSLSTPVTASLLCHLQHFHKLRQLVVSLWLLTW